jgi:hypothetical protein
MEEKYERCKREKEEEEEKRKRKQGAYTRS